MQDPLATAVELHQSGRWTEAESAYRLALHENPENSEALHLLGLLAHHKGDNGAATDLIRRAIAIRGDRAVYHFNLGVVLAASGDETGAERAYRRCLELAPDRGDAHNNLGLLFHGRGEHERAMVSFRDAIARQPEHAEAHANLGRVLQEQGDDAAALAEFERALAIEPRLAEAHFGRGRSLERQDRWQEAEQAYLAALEARPGFHEAQNNLAAVLLAEGRYGEAQQAFDELRRLLRGPEAETAGEVLSAGRAEGTGTGILSATEFSLLDRAQQIEHLLGTGVIEPGFAEVAERLRALLPAFSSGAARDWRRSLTAEQRADIGGALERVIHIADAPRMSSRAVNLALDFAAIEQAYLSSETPVVYFDDFLSPQALAGLRRFCRDSTSISGPIRPASSPPPWPAASTAASCTRLRKS